MKNFIRENWFKLGLLLIGLIWVFSSVILPKYSGVKCFKLALKGASTNEEKSVDKSDYDFMYKVCMDKQGF